MNIKGLGQQLLSIDLIKKTDRNRKTVQTQDREPGNQGGNGGQEQARHHLTEEELQEALKRLQEVPGVKENNFQFRVTRDENRIIVFVEDPSGKVLRRMTDQELWLFLQEKSNRSKGNLLNKAM